MWKPGIHVASNTHEFISYLGEVLVTLFSTRLSFPCHMTFALVAVTFAWRGVAEFVFTLHKEEGLGRVTWENSAK